MRLRSTILVATLLLILPGARAACASTDGYSASPFRAGEKLRYKIKWGPIRLGTMEVIQARADSGDTSHFVLRMTGVSAKGLPFIKMNWANRAELDPRHPTNWVFTHEEAGDRTSRVVYRSDSSATELCIENASAEEGHHYSRLAHASPLYDSVGMFMLIRGMSGSGRDMDVPTIVAQRAENTHFRFTDEAREQDVNGLPSKVRVRHFTARSDYNCQSCGGLTGSFQGWVTDDEAAVPVELSMKIAVGSVKITLEEFERPGGLGVSNPAPAGKAEKP